MFEEAGRKAEDYLKVKKLDPMYRLKFSDFEIMANHDPAGMKSQIEKFFPDSVKGYDIFLKKEKNGMKSFFPACKNHIRNFQILLTVVLSGQYLIFPWVKACIKHWVIILNLPIYGWHSPFSLNIWVCHPGNVLQPLPWSPLLNMSMAFIMLWVG